MDKKLFKKIIGNILDDFPKDSDGSSKVALIAIDRSIAAWGNMRKHFPERGDDIIDLLVHLAAVKWKMCNSCSHRIFLFNKIYTNYLS